MFTNGKTQNRYKGPKASADFVKFVQEFLLNGGEVQQTFENSAVVDFKSVEDYYDYVREFC